MSKELVISAASHERRVAILEEGQLVEIYIEREKEFALVGSIYKGKVTRVLPGMQSAFVDIGLDGDAFLYVSDVFENLEDYDSGHPHEQPQASVASPSPANGSPVEVLPGESLARAAEHHEEARHEESHQDQARHADEQQASHDEAPVAEGQHLEEHHDALQSAPGEEQPAEAGEERQPDSNASAPQNFAPRYNPTQSYPARGANDRAGQNFGRGGDRGGDRGRGGRWGRRGGRHRGGRPQQAGPGGRNLPPSKYASPQGSESRGYENRGGQPRSHDNRRSEAPRSPAPSLANVTEEEIILPGESLAKYRGKPAIAPTPAPIVEHETREEQAAVEEITPRATGSLPASAPSGSSAPRRFSGGLPRWLLAGAGAEAEAPPAGEAADAAEEASAAGSAVVEPPRDDVEAARNDADLNEDQVAALASVSSRLSTKRHRKKRRPMRLSVTPNSMKKKQKNKGKKLRNHRLLKFPNSPRTKSRKSKRDARPTGLNLLRTPLKNMLNTTQRMTTKSTARMNRSTTCTPRSGISKRE